MMKIGDVEKKTGLAQKTIRYYESCGLITVMRQENQYRSYDEETVEILLAIKALRAVGVSVADIRLWRDGVVSWEELLRKQLVALEDDGKKSRELRVLCERYLRAGFLTAQIDTSLLFYEKELPLIQAKFSHIPLFLGVDIGTTSLSAQVVVAEGGEVIKTYSFEHAADMQIEGYPEAYAADAEKLLDRTLALVESLVKTYPSIRSIGIAGQMHGIVCLDIEGNILSPLYTWRNEFGLLSSDGGETIGEKAKRLTGQTISTGYGVMTCYALKELGLWDEKTATVATIMDVVTARLCQSTPVMHPTNAASLGAYSIEKRAFQKELLEQLRLSPTLFPAVSEDFAILGEYVVENKKIPVAVAIGDNQAGIFGSLAEDDMVLVNVGTSSQVSVICKDPIGGDLRPYFGGKYISSGAALCGGRAYATLHKLIKSILSSFGQEISSQEIYDYLNREAENAKEPKLLVTTAFSGTREDPSVRGDISNIGIQNLTPSALAYGFLEGIVTELYGMYVAMIPKGEKHTLVVSGNAMRRNRVLRQICGKIFDDEPLLPRHTEEAAFGAALFGAVCVGLIDEKDRSCLVRYQEKT